MTIYQVLKKYWNYDSFRPLQEDIIQSVLDGKDTLALLPTGGGKSICFQVPAIVNPGICIVVSPLIALMKDQVENLKSRGIEAVAIVSGMGKREVDIMLDNCVYGKIKFLYLSPERLMSDLVRARISYMNVNLIAVDEAHCISQWGYDFRPPYLHIADIRELHPQVPVLALTATATERVVEDIQQKLLFKKPNVLRKSFARKNLSYVVAHEENKYRKLFSIAANIEGTGIVYVRNRRETQEVSRLLNNEGYNADFYHAGIDTPGRSLKQEAWKKNETRIIVATNAFGMGIDKADVRFVVHLDLPGSLEAYYQEAGRGGRDEKKAYAVLLYNQADRIQLEKKLELSFPSIEEIRQVYHALGNYYQIAYGAGEGLVFEFDIGDFCSRFKLDALKTLSALKFLEHDEYISLTESVYLPSRLKIVVAAEDLYRFQIEYAGYDAFIKLLLRSYGGLFEQYTPVRESEIARRSGKTTREVMQILEKLEELGLLSYLKQTDMPQLQFVKARADGAHLNIDTKYIALRKQIMQSQVKAVVHYAEAKACRSRLLLEYFNEPESDKCGICDVCLEEKRLANSKGLFEQITFEIIQILSSQHLSLEEIITSLHSGNEKERIDALRNLLDAGKVKSDGTKYYV
ncbi:RecQ family ATP-dependent DNA helicase [Arcticibacter tournemirensis]|uniref:ATP-dependent DNA helicase RecQ n=1 Tax=Arcticibacter tournemirensis TaxID=699437 RepID=A0A4Q0M993_9SPHI|nr:ATP-dependent DNA helicase RecQ [Arcticibacter tournemirensis]RXF69761.1 RecQ family ATP-dependent DNA helicase [Arcticibacter tournemirensis]